jgi:hypothetical protein
MTLRVHSTKWLLLGLLFMLFAISVSSAQEATESAPIISTVGPVQVTHPESWSALDGPRGVVILAKFNGDVQRDGEELALPDDALLVQLRLFGLNRVSGLSEDPAAFELLGALLLNQMEDQNPESLPPIQEFEGENYTFARADVSTPEVQTFVYTAILSDATFAIITATTGQAGALEAAEQEYLGILDAIELEFEAPLDEAGFEQYARFGRSVNDAGFPLLGNPEAPVRLLFISSFDCTGCRTFNATFLPALLPRIEIGEVAFLFAPVYGLDEFAEGDSAARASLCVGAENFWGYHDTLYEWQDFDGFAFVYERLQNGAAALDVDPQAFDECYTSVETTAVLQSALEASFEYADGVRAPMVVVNGTLVENNLDAINAAIDAALAESN